MPSVALQKGKLMGTVTHLPPAVPQPAPGYTALAASILAAGFGPEIVPYLVSGSASAGEVSMALTGAMATLEASQCPA